MNEDLPPSANPESVRDKVQQAVSTARTRASEAVVRGRETVAEHPGTSLLSVFAAGVVVGALVAIATRPSPRPVLPVAEGRDRLAAMLGALAESLREPVSRTYATAAEQAAHASDVVSRAMDALQERKARWFK